MLAITGGDMLRVLQLLTNARRDCGAALNPHQPFAGSAILLPGIKQSIRSGLQHPRRSPHPGRPCHPHTERVWKDCAVALST